jgi:FkbM family methyltransferase
VRENRRAYAKRDCDRSSVFRLAWEHLSADLGGFQVRLSDLLSPLNPLGFFERRFRQVNNRLKDRAEFERVLARGLVDRFDALDRRLDALASSGGGGRCDALHARFDALQGQLERLENAQDRMWRHLDQVRINLSSYLGDGVALTHTVGGWPMLITANDIGCSVSLVSGGRYEEHNTNLLLSFTEPETVFLDIGANIGYFSLLLGQRLSGQGHVYAFEPHPQLVDLLTRNLFLNGLDKRVTVFPFALSDRDAAAAMQYPAGHLGGGWVLDPADAAAGNLTGEIKRLDELLDPGFTCDLVKIDVEGHELSVLRGMRRIVANSPRIKVLFEKLYPDMPNDAAVEAYFRELGFDLYGVQDDVSLLPLQAGDLRGWAGYALAARPGTIRGGLGRLQFSVYPAQLIVPGDRSPGRDQLQRRGERGQLLFRGPFWFLRAGTWHMRLHGRIRGAVLIMVFESLGGKVTQFELAAGQSEHVLVLTRDLVAFEFVVYAISDATEIVVERIEMIGET